jgi:hypothetical protein
MKKEMQVLVEVCGIFSRNPTVDNCGAVEQALANLAELNKCHTADGKPAPAWSQAVHPHISAFAEMRTGFINESNQFQATGSAMGRKSWRGHDAETPVKCYIKRLKWVDGDYDEQGAYWGGGNGDFIYWANFDIGETNEDIFVRAYTRDEAKEEIRKQLPMAKFFN